MPIDETVHIRTTGRTRCRLFSCVLGDYSLASYVVGLTLYLSVLIPLAWAFHRFPFVRPAAAVPGAACPLPFALYTVRMLLSRGKVGRRIIME